MPIKRGAESAQAALESDGRKMVAGEGGEAKRAKLTPIFAAAKRAASGSASVASGSASSTSSPSSSSSSFVWQTPAGPRGTCLHGTYGQPKPSTKIAAYDLDGTLINPKGGKTFPSPSDPDDWAFWSRLVPEVLQREHANGAAIIIISNQNIKDKKLETWKRKIKRLAPGLGVPFHIFAALEKDQFRKPAPGMWDELTANWNDNIEVDLAASFYVGDAAGRTKGSRRMKADHNDTDRKWALNVGLRFMTPEQAFADKPEEEPYVLKGWRPVVEENVEGAEAGAEPVYSPTSTPLIPATEAEKRNEIVLFVGPPASGKTSFYRRHFSPHDYVWVNQDTLKTREKCLKAVEMALESGHGCVVDNTNRDVATRKVYVTLARKLGKRIRCVVFDVDKERCNHNNLFRAYGGVPGEPTRTALPYGVISSFFSAYETPTKAEGFDEEPKIVRWKLEGSEEVRRRYAFWYT